MNITIYIANPTSWEYIESEELKQRKEAEKQGRILLYPYGVSDKIKATFKYTDDLWNLFNHVAYDRKDIPTNPVVIEVQENQDAEKIACTLWQPTKTEDKIECEFHVNDRGEE